MQHIFTKFENLINHGSIKRLRMKRENWHEDMLSIFLGKRIKQKKPCLEENTDLEKTIAFMLWIAFCMRKYTRLQR